MYYHKSFWHIIGIDSWNDLFYFSVNLKIRAGELFCGHLQSIFQYFKPKTVGSLNLTKCSIPLRYDKVPQVPTYPPEWMEHKLFCAEVNFFKLCSFPAGTCLSSSAQQSFGNYGVVLLGLWKATWKCPKNQPSRLQLGHD